MHKDFVRNFLLENLDTTRNKIKDYLYPYLIMKVNVDGRSHVESMLPLGALDIFGSEHINKNKENELLIRFLYGYLAKAKTLNYGDTADSTVPFKCKTLL